MILALTSGTQMQDVAWDIFHTFLHVADDISCHVLAKKPTHLARKSQRVALPQRNSRLTFSHTSLALVPSLIEGLRVV